MIFLFTDVTAYGTWFFESLSTFLSSPPMIWFWGLLAVVIIVKMFILFCKFR